MILERFKVPPKDQVLVSEAALRRTVSQIFEKLGVSPDDAAEAGDQHLILLGNLEALEDHHSLLAQCLWTYLVRLRPLFEAR